MHKPVLFLFLNLSASWAWPAYSEDVVMLFGHSLAPYVIEKDNAGVELQILKEALAKQGHKLIPLYTTLGKVPLLFNLKNVDAVHRNFTKKSTDTNTNKNTGKTGFFGDVSISYHDVFVTLEERNIVLNTPEDLKKYSLITFEDAGRHYPDWLTSDYVYSQTAEQITQVKLLQNGFVDVVLSDRNIFSDNIKRYRQLSGNVIKPMRLHNFVSPYSYRPMFKSEKVTADYNNGLRELKKSGRYQQILSALLKQDNAIVKQLDIKDSQ